MFNFGAINNQQSFGPGVACASGLFSGGCAQANQPFNPSIDEPGSECANAAFAYWPAIQSNTPEEVMRG